MSIISVTSASDTTALDKLANCMRSGKVCVLFYADLCGYCQQFKPEWSKLKEMHTINNVSNYHLADIEAVAINALKARMKDMSQMIEVSGYPTISFYDNGKKVQDYNGERTAVSVMDQLNSVLNNSTKNDKKLLNHKKNNNYKHNKHNSNHNNHNNHKHKNNKNNNNHKSKKNKKSKKKSGKSLKKMNIKII